MHPSFRHAGRGVVAAALLATACTGRTGSVPASERVSGPTISASRGMVVSASTIASEVGRDVLADGGNAVDAAVATGLRPGRHLSGGGQRGRRWIHGDPLPRRPGDDDRLPRDGPARGVADDVHRFHRRLLASACITRAAGRSACRAPWPDSRSRMAKYGRTQWSRLAAPAVRARRRRLRRSARAAPIAAVALREGFAPYPASIAAYSRGGTPYAAGDTIRQPDLARTLAPHPRRRARWFLSGRDGAADRAYMRAHGGLITRGRPRRLRGEGARAGARHLSRLRDHLDAAADLRRLALDGDAEHPRGL